MNLIINDRGFSFDLPGMGTIRTPCKIDITRCNINIVISTLKQQGITSYKIVESPNHDDISTLPKNSKVIKSDKTKNVVIHKVESSDNSIELKKLTKQFNDLKELLIEKIVEVTAVPKSPKDINIPTEKIKSKNKNPKVEELDDDEFVPEIILDDLELSGSKVEEVNMDNILSDVDILRELKGGDR